MPNGSESDTDESMGTNPMPSRSEPDAKVSIGTKPIPIRDESNVENVTYANKPDVEGE